MFGILSPGQVYRFLKSESYSDSTWNKMNNNDDKNKITSCIPHYQESQGTGQDKLHHETDTKVILLVISFAKTTVFGLFRASV